MNRLGWAYLKIRYKIMALLKESTKIFSKLSINYFAIVTVRFLNLSFLRQFKARITD